MYIEFSSGAVILIFDLSLLNSNESISLSNFNIDNF